MKGILRMGEHDPLTPCSILHHPAKPLQQHRPPLTTTIPVLYFLLFNASKRNVEKLQGLPHPLYRTRKRGQLLMNLILWVYLQFGDLLRCARLTVCRRTNTTDTKGKHGRIWHTLIQAAPDWSEYRRVSVDRLASPSVGA